MSDDEVVPIGLTRAEAIEANARWRHRPEPAPMSAWLADLQPTEATESTSARLRRVEQERDSACALSVQLLKDLELAASELTATRAELDMAVTARQAALHDAAKAVAEADAKREQAVENAAGWHREWQLAKAELATARAELKQLRGGWIVARDGGRHCERCEQEIRPGEAFSPTPGSEHLVLHVHCPTQEAS
jgi:chromosome segregation ATPase